VAKIQLPRTFFLFFKNYGLAIGCPWVTLETD